MTLEQFQLNTEPYVPRGVENMFFRQERVSATLIDPATGARLNELASTCGVDVHRTHDNDVAMVSTTGKALQEALGNDEFSHFLNAAILMAGEMTDVVIPDHLVSALAEGKGESFEALGRHVKTCLEKHVQVENQACKGTLLSIGGQSMTIKVEYQANHEVNPRIFVVKVPSPLTLLGFSANSIPIIQPYFGEMLRREILSHDIKFRHVCDDNNFTLSPLLFASNYLAIEDWVEGNVPQEDDADLWRIVANFSSVTNEILQDIRTRSPNEQIRLFMSSVRALDIRVMSNKPFAPPEKSMPKVANFIKRFDETVVCIDPFIPLSLRITEVVQQTPKMTAEQRKFFTEALGRIIRGEELTAPF